MRRVVTIALSSLCLTACGQWVGDGTDEVIPDAVGLATNRAVKPSFGVPSQSINDHADENILHNRKSLEEQEAAEAAHESMHEGGVAAPHKE
jgi:hypothetical protein